MFLHWEGGPCESTTIGNITRLDKIIAENEAPTGSNEDALSWPWRKKVGRRLIVDKIRLPTPAPLRSAPLCSTLSFDLLLCVPLFLLVNIFFVGDVTNHIFHSQQFFSISVGNFETKFILHCHDNFHVVQ